MANASPLSRRLFTLAGRASRTELLIAYLLASLTMVPLILLLMLESSLTAAGAGAVMANLAGFLLVLAVVLALAGLVSLLTFYVRRSRDAFGTGWMALGLCVPLVNVVVALLLFVLPPVDAPSEPRVG